MSSKRRGGKRTFGSPGGPLLSQGTRTQTPGATVRKQHELTEALFGQHASSGQSGKVSQFAKDRRARKVCTRLGCDHDPTCTVGFKFYAKGMPRCDDSSITMDTTVAVCRGCVPAIVDEGFDGWGIKRLIERVNRTLTEMGKYPLDGSEPEFVFTPIIGEG